ncbi:hypothetical protein C5167_021816 [Papaver somniferum]|uniref:Uncharacterized protein n=1 Tax=Papaver somniferum TaxID=3469 RepID=A0A4Y7JFZ2_PAPSO|nr:hypothetical protein C5167_021816 [Papaver somniferum]
MMMNAAKVSERIESSFSVEAILDLKLNDEDIQVVPQGAFSGENPNKSRASAWINGDGMYRTYEIYAESESEEFVGAYGCQSASGEFIQVYAQSGFEKQVEANADDDNTSSQQEEADIVTGAGDGEEEEKEKDDGKQPVQEEEADADDSGTNRQSDVEQQEADNVTGAHKEEQEVEEDVRKQPVQVKDADTITGTGEEEEEEAARGHQVQENPRVEEYLVTKIEPTKTQINSSAPISTFNPYDVLGKKVNDVDDDEEDENNQPTA